MLGTVTVPLTELHSAVECGSGAGWHVSGRAVTREQCSAVHYSAVQYTTVPVDLESGTKVGLGRSKELSVLQA